MLETFTSVLMLILFLVPGFVWRTVEGQFVYLDKRLPWEKLVLGLLTRSSIIYLLWAHPLDRGWQDAWMQNPPILTGLKGIAFLLILPAVLGFVVGVIKQKKWIPWLFAKVKLGTFEQHEIPSAWDSFFSCLEPYWIVVTLKNGSKVHGFLGEASFVSSDPEDRDIYISHTLTLNENNQLEFVKDTKGVYIRGEEISVINFIQPSQTGGSHGTTESSQ